MQASETRQTAKTVSAIQLNKRRAGPPIPIVRLMTKSRPRFSHEVAAACSRGRQPAVPVESTSKSHEVATASVVVACYRHFVANQSWAIRYRGLTPTAICYRHFVASLNRPWSPRSKTSLRSSGSPTPNALSRCRNCASLFRPTGGHSHVSGAARHHPVRCWQRTAG